MSNHLSTDSDLTRGESLACGAVAGLVTRFVVAPLDMVKIRMQLSPHSGALATTARVLKSEGVRALWKGNAPAELLYVLYSSVQFSTLRGMNHALKAMGLRNEQARQFIAGGCAGSAATFASYPLDYLRTRTAALRGRRSQLYNTILRVYKLEGMRGFYHGATATVVAVFPYMALFFGSYSLLRENERLKSFPALFTAASLASVFAKAAVYPLDTIRKRVQVHGARAPHDAAAAGGSSGVRYSHNVLQAGRQIVAKEGVRGLYRGCAVAVLKAWPGAFVSITVFEVSLSSIRRLRGLQ